MCTHYGYMHDYEGVSSLVVAATHRWYAITVVVVQGSISTTAPPRYGAAHL